MNDVKLQEGHPVDENLRPIKVGGKSTAIETAQHGNGARINGDLEVTGDITGNIKDMVLEDVTLDSLTTNSIVSTDLTIDDSGDITLDSGGQQLYIKSGGVDFIKFDYATGEMIMYPVGSTGDYLRFDVAANGVSVIETVDEGGLASAGHLTIRVDGNCNIDAQLAIDLESSNGAITLDSSTDIILDSHAGNFIAKKAGTEFSADNSAYAGMILGCTHVFGSGAYGAFVQISTAWENLLWDTDKYALVTFVVPPSNRVKIAVHLPFIAAASFQVRLGLATDSSATTLNTKYENDVDDANRADSFNLNYSWVVEGSDHSWSAGETKTIYIMAYTASNVRFYTGGTATSAYGGVIVEATALPATIGNGEEP